MHTQKIAVNASTTLPTQGFDYELRYQSLFDANDAVLAAADAVRATCLA